MKRDALTETKVKQLKPRSRDYKIADGTIGGMYLLVPPTGRKVFYLAFQWEGKTRLLHLGAYPIFNLEEARERARAAKKQVALGTNPAEARKAEKKQIKAASTTFRMVAAEWLKWRQPVLSPTTVDDIVKRLENHVMPRFGDKPIADVTKADIKTILDGLQARGTFEALKQVRISISQVLRYAIDTEAAPGLVDWTTQLHRMYTSSESVMKHRAAITKPSEVKGLMLAIEAYADTSLFMHLALKFSALTFCRPGEVRHAEWSDIDWEDKLWRIPAEKMKMRQPHLVPLARQTVELLRTLQVMTGHSRYLFPSVRSAARPMSEAAVNAAIRRMGYTKEQMCAHGFRGMASSMLNEKGFNRDWIERQLAHTPVDKVRAAYLHTEFLDGRRSMMQDWADYLCEPELETA